MYWYIHFFFKEQTSCLLKELQVGFQYFLQVQALAQFGRNRLKGEKAAIILNTTNHTTSKLCLGIDNGMDIEL